MRLLAGYGRYRRTIWNLALGQQYNKFTPSVARDTIRKQIERMMPGGRMRQKLMRTFLVLSPELESIYFDNFAVFPAPMQQHMFTRETMDRIRSIDPYVELRRLLERTKDLSLLDGLLYADIKTYLHELLMKQDQMSMATSIESRVPFLDHKLVEFTARMPDTMKLRGGTTKYVLRESMKGVLPEKILSRSKMGFPGADWQLVSWAIQVGDRRICVKRAGVVARHLCARFRAQTRVAASGRRRPFRAAVGAAQL